MRRSTSTPDEPEYWARRAKKFGVSRELEDAWANTSALARRAAPTTDVEVIGGYLVAPETRQDEGDGVVSYHLAAQPRCWWWLVLVPPPSTGMLPLRTTSGDIWWYRRQVREALREARLAAMPPTLMAQPIIGWRAWGVSRRRTRLVSPIQETVWPVGEPLVAMRDDEPVERVKPDAGIYAAKDVAHVSGGAVIGRVALWGDVVECERGWIGQYAYPYALPAEWARVYGCEVLPPEKVPA